MFNMAEVDRNIVMGEEERNTERITSGKDRHAAMSEAEGNNTMPINEQKHLSIGLGSAKRRRCLTLEDKVKLLKAIDAGGDKKSILARKYGISKSTLSTIIINRDKIESAFTTSKFQPSRKRMRGGKFSQLEDELFSWFEQEHSVGVPIADAVLERKARELAQDMELGEFTASSGWLTRFKERKGIIRHRNPALTGARKRKKMNKYPTKICANQSGSGQDEPDEFLADFMTWADSSNWTDALIPELLRVHSAAHIFSVIEIGLFYRCLPFEGKTFKSESCASGELAHERLTVTAAANLDGSRKLPLFCIGKDKHPKCLKNVVNLPVRYRGNETAMMSPQLFGDWLRDLDQQFQREGIKVVMLVDTSPAHSYPVDLHAIELVFLPPHTTRNFQSHDKGIAYSLKRSYREIMVKKLIMHVQEVSNCQNKNQSESKPAGPSDLLLLQNPQQTKLLESSLTPGLLCSQESLSGAFTWTLLEALHGLRKAWDSVSSEMVKNSFMETGFSTSRGDVIITGATGSISPHASYKSLYNRLSSLLSLDVTSGEYVNVDRRVVTWDQIIPVNNMISSNCTGLTLASSVNSQLMMESGYNSVFPGGSGSAYQNNPNFPLSSGGHSAFGPPAPATSSANSAYNPIPSHSNVYGQSFAGPSSGPAYVSSVHGTAVGPFCSSTLPDPNPSYAPSLSASGAMPNGCYASAHSRLDTGPGLGFNSGQANSGDMNLSGSSQPGQPVDSSTPCSRYGNVQNRLAPTQTGSVKKSRDSSSQSPKTFLALTSSDQADSAPPVPTATQAINCMSVLRRFIEAKPAESGEARVLYQSLASVEDFVDNVVLSAPRQKSIADYFGRKK